MADRLDGFVRMIKNAIEKNWDFVIVVDGMEGAGKSTMALHMKGLYDGKYSLVNVLFDAKNLLDVMDKAPDKSCILLDESIISLYKRDAMKEFQGMLVKAFSIIRAKNFFFILVLPNFWDLDPNLRTRAHYRFYVYSKRGERGYVKIYKPKRDEWTTGSAWQDLQWEYRFPMLPERFGKVYHQFKFENLMATIKDLDQQQERNVQAEKDKKTGIKGVKMKAVMEYLKERPEASVKDVALSVGCTPTYVKDIMRLVKVKPKQKDSS